MTNYELICEFIAGRKNYGAVNHLAYGGNTLINYSTVMVEIDRENKTANMNIRKYSRTTSKIQSMIRSALTSAGYDIIEMDGEPCRYWNYGYMGAPSWTAKEAREMFKEGRLK